MSRTKRSAAVIAHNWAYKSHSLAQFKASCITDYNGDMYGYIPKSRHGRSHLISAWDDIVPSAASEVKYPSQVK